MSTTTKAKDRSMVEATPRPWENPDNAPTVRRIRGRKGPEYFSKTLSDGSGLMPAKVFGRTREECEERASLTVQAVNAHGPLLEATRAALKALEGEDPTSNETDAQRFHTLAAMLSDAIEAAEGEA